MNSFRAVERAINYEIKRQTEILDDGKTPKMETRGWVDDKGHTVSQRSKEESQDYRYFPEPDLPVMHFSKTFLDELRKQLPEMPKVRKARFIEKYGVIERDVDILIGYKELAEFFEGVMLKLDKWMQAGHSVIGNEAKRGQMVASWIIGPFLSALNESNLHPAESKVTQENFVELVMLIRTGQVSNLKAKDVFTRMFETGEKSLKILNELGLTQVSDERVTWAAVKKVAEANPKNVEDAKNNPKAVSSIIGLVMKEMQGKGNPQQISEIVKKELGI